MSTETVGIGTNRITVYLTDRDPIDLDAEAWPMIARGTGDSYRVGNYDVARYDQARANGEVDEYKLIVRQHADGRTLVYGIFDAAAARGGESVRGGDMLTRRPPMDVLAMTIRLVGRELHFPERVIRECFESFEPEDLGEVTSTKKITVYLTDRNPVNVDPKEWPICARGTGDSHQGSHGPEYEQARAQGQYDEYKLIVRQHTDGRTLVYGIVDAAPAWTGNASVRGGELLTRRPDTDELFRIVRQVGEELGLPNAVIRDCFESFQPEEL